MAHQNTKNKKSVSATDISADKTPKPRTRKPAAATENNADKTPKPRTRKPAAATENNADQQSTLFGHDARHREVHLIKTAKGFKVTKTACNSPLEQTYKTEKEAIAAATQLIDDMTK